MSEGISGVLRNTCAAYSNPTAFVSKKGQEMIVRVLAFDQWGNADICFCFATVNTVAIAIIARTNHLKKSRIISVVCILDGAFLLWAWSQHPLGGVLKNLKSHDAVLAQQTGAHSANNLLQQQLIIEEREEFGKISTNLSETQQNLSETEESIRATNGMTRKQLVEIAGQVVRLTTENDRAVAENDRQETVTARLEAATAKQEMQTSLDANALLQTVTQAIREEGKSLGKDLEQLIAAVERVVPRSASLGTCAQEAGRV